MGEVMERKRMLNVDLGPQRKSTEVIVLSEVRCTETIWILKSNSVTSSRVPETNNHDCLSQSFGQIGKRNQANSLRAEEYQNSAKDVGNGEYTKPQCQRY